MSNKPKVRRKFGDRFDGVLIKDLDPMHVICPILYPDRCDNEAYISERIDMGPIREYIAKKNEGEQEFPYTPFHIIVTAAIKLLYLRPKLNRFVANKLMYQRRDITASFVVKKLFSDDGAEALALINSDPEDTINTLHEKLFKQVSTGRSDVLDKSSESMDIISRMPRRLTRLFCEIICFLDRIGKCPRGLIETDPYYSSVVLTNMGSLHVKGGYHHLTNWGTNSIFVFVGEIKNTLHLTKDGKTEVKETIDLGLTIDERLADGYYYSKSIRLLKKLLANPELLELPMNEEVEY